MFCKSLLVLLSLCHCIVCPSIYSFSTPLVMVMAFYAFTIFKLNRGSQSLLVEETGVPRENPRLVASYWQTLSHNVVSNTPRLSGIRTQTHSGDWHWLHWYVNPTTIRSRPRRSLLYPLVPSSFSLDRH
jgi:hypothetical protein